MTAGRCGCFHCGLAIGSGQAVSSAEEGRVLEFCCHGCLSAYRLIQGSGLGEFYQRRSAAGAGVEGGAYRTSYDDTALVPHVFGLQGRSAIDILIDGIRCATCVWLNERMVAALPGVTEIRVNYATHRARVVFDGELVSPAAILERIAALGYRPRPYTRTAAESAAEAQRVDLLVRFGTALFLSMQLMASAVALYAGYFQGISSQFKGWLNFFSLLVTTPVVWYCGWPFLAGACRSLRNKAPSMDLLIATGTLASYGYSCHAVLTGGEAYFETAAMIVTLILAGRILESGARRRALAGVDRLRELAPSQARLCRDDGTVMVAAAAVMPGDLLQVEAGERFPVDGVVWHGVTEADESPATGEPLPVMKRPGSRLLAGSVNLLETVRVRAEHSAADSFVARTARLVEDAQQNKAPIQQVVDRISAFFVPIVLVLALLTGAWLLFVGLAPGDALLRALAVVLIACPCALGLATPTAILAASGSAAAGGVVFRGGDVLEQLARVKVVAFDKTGTVTCGEPVVVQVLPVGGTAASGLLALVAPLESRVDHPLARGITALVLAQGIPVAEAWKVSPVPGGGVTGETAQGRVLVGTRRFLEGEGIALPEIAWHQEPGGTVVHCACNGRYAGAIVLSDALRPGIKGLVAYLEEQGIASWLLSGDREANARRIGEELGIGNVRGGMTPEEKGAFLAALRLEGRRVLMVGDGINDAPALAAASIGCSFAGGTDIAIETADLVLAAADPARLEFAHRLARRTMRVIGQNLAWAFLYNLIGIPLAIGGELTPVYAAAAMTVSSLCVVLNSTRLRNVRHG